MPASCAATTSSTNSNHKKPDARASCVGSGLIVTAHCAWRVCKRSMGAGRSSPTSVIVTPAFGEQGRYVLPSRIQLTRPQDRYSIEVVYQAPEAVVLDRQYDPMLFVLQNKWQLPEVDLDARDQSAPAVKR